MKILDKLYDFVISLQFVFLFMFIAENYDDLDNIEYILEITSEITLNFTINFYAIMGVIVAIFVLIIVSSTQLFGTGLSDEGTHNLGKISAFIVLYLILEVATLYYIQFLTYESLINVAITLIHLLKIMSDKLNE